MKKILLLLGHPQRDSFCGALFDAYLKGAKKTDAEVKTLSLPEMDFDPIMHNGYNKRQELEPDLVKAQELITWCDHLVVFYPIWWGNIPALFKGFLDRILLPRYAFKFHSLTKWDKLLAGRSCHLVSTMGGLKWFYFLLLGGGVQTILKRYTFGFCGFKPIRTTYIDMLQHKDEAYREKWLRKMEAIGQRLK